MGGAAIHVEKDEQAWQGGEVLSILELFTWEILGNLGREIEEMVEGPYPELREGVQIEVHI